MSASEGRGLHERTVTVSTGRVAVSASGGRMIAVSDARVDLFTGDGSRSLRAKASFPRARVVVSVSRGVRDVRAGRGLRERTVTASRRAARTAPCMAKVE